MKKTFLSTSLLVLLATLAACGTTTTEPTITPSVETPTTQTTTATPTTAKPTTQTPTTAKPTTQTPTTAKPTTQTPTTVPPTTVPPTTVPPTTVPPTTVPPTTQTPTTVVPVVNEIKGKIVDQNGANVKDVKIYLTYQTIQVALQTSGEDGTFTFTNVEEATYNVILVPPTDAYEYKGAKITIEYTGGTYNLPNIVLTKIDMNWGALS